MEKSIFIVMENIDYCVTNVWHFHAKDKFDVAQQIIDNLDYYDYQKMFNGQNWGSGIGRWRFDDKEYRTVESLLKAISDATPEKDNESGFQIYKLDIRKDRGLAQEQTWTTDQHIYEHYRNKQ